MSVASKLALQFYFNDDGKNMDALVRNENEKELLAILKAITSVLGFPLGLESEGVQQGGFKQLWTLTGESSPQINTVLALTSLFISVKPKKESPAEKNTNASEEKGAGVQKKKTVLDKAKKQLRETEKLDAESMKELIAVLEANPRLVWHRSNFYKKLNQYARVERFSIGLLDENFVLVGAERPVVRKSFSAFVVNSNELPPNVDEEAVVEIVAPVLTTARSKWKGIYKGKPVSFDLKDDEFKKSVFSQRIEFKNGVAIKCVLQQVQSIDGRGVLKTKSITVLNVAGVINRGGTAISSLLPVTTQSVPVAPPAVSVVQENAPVIAPKKTPKVDDRQLDMFA